MITRRTTLGLSSRWFLLFYEKILLQYADRVLNIYIYIYIIEFLDRFFHCISSGTVLSAEN